MISTLKKRSLKMRFNEKGLLYQHLAHITSRKTVITLSKKGLSDHKTSSMEAAIFENARNTLQCKMFSEILGELGTFERT